jgi:hypothetical protein
MGKTMKVPGPGSYETKKWVGFEGHKKTMSACLTYAPHVKE